MKLSRVEKNGEIKHLLKFNLPFKGLVKHRGKCEIKMQQNFCIAKSENCDAAKITGFTVLSVSVFVNLAKISLIVGSEYIHRDFKKIISDSSLFLHC